MLSPVPGEAVNLVDNDVIHPVSVLFDILQHFLKFWAVSGLGGRAPVDELFAHYCTHGEGFFLVCLPLGGDRKALVRATASLSLPPCRHAKVGHSELWRHAGGECAHGTFCCRKTH